MEKNISLLKKIWADKKWVTISNLLTLLRLLLAPVIVALLYRQRWKLAIVIFMIAAATDLLDGHLARAFDEKTYLGTFLDPVADKVLLLSTFGSLAFINSPFFHIPKWFVFIVLLREILILFGSLCVIFFYKKAHIQPTIWGKLTTFSQIIFLTWIFLCYFFSWQLQKTNSIALVILVIFSILSFLQYLNRAIHDIQISDII